MSSTEIILSRLGCFGFSLLEHRHIKCYRIPVACRQIVPLDAYLCMPQGVNLTRVKSMCLNIALRDTNSRCVYDNFQMRFCEYVLKVRDIIPSKFSWNPMTLQPVEDQGFLTDCWPHFFLSSERGGRWCSQFRGHVVTGSHFWTKFWRASTTLTCPSGPVSTVCHRNRTSWEIIGGEATIDLKRLQCIG